MEKPERHMRGSVEADDRGEAVEEHERFEGHEEGLLKRTRSRA